METVQFTTIETIYMSYMIVGILIMCLDAFIENPLLIKMGSSALILATTDKRCSQDLKQLWKKLPPIPVWKWICAVYVLPIFILSFVLVYIIMQTKKRFLLLCC